MVATTVITSAVATVMFKTGMVKTSSVEIGPVIPFEIGTIMGIIKPIPVVTIPGRIVIIGISGIIVFIDDGCGGISILINRGGSISIGVDRCRSISILVNRGGLINRSRCIDWCGHCPNIYMGAGYPEAYMGIYKDL